MSRMRYQATRSLTVMVIATMPTLALAQAAAQPNPAADHLAAARTALNKVLNSPVPPGDMFKKVSDLKTEYLLLERSASTASPEWFAHYTMLDRLIGELLGPSSSSTETGAVGTSGRAGSPAGHLDAGAAANLQEFRTHLMAFSAAMSAVTPGAAPAAPEPTASAPSPPPPAAAAEPDTSALVDQTTALVDSALSVGAQESDTVSVDRAMLQQIKKQLERIKQRMSTP